MEEGSPSSSKTHRQVEEFVATDRSTPTLLLVLLVKAVVNSTACRRVKGDAGDMVWVSIVLSVLILFVYLQD